MKTSRNKILFYTSVFIILISLFLMNRGKPCFPANLPNNFNGNSAIIALEFSADKESILPIFNDACKDGTLNKNQRIEYFKNSICWDHLFIVGYCLFFISIVLSWINKKPNVRKGLIVAIILVGVFDVCENALLCKIILAIEKQQELSVPILNYMFLSSYAKWTVLFLSTILIFFLSFPSSLIKNITSAVLVILIILFIATPFSSFPIIGNIAVLVTLVFFLTWLFFLIRYIVLTIKGSQVQKSLME